MKTPIIQREFEKRITNKFNVYNSLFLNLPYPNVSNVGMLIPILHKICEESIEAGLQPRETLNVFFNSQTDFDTEQKKIDFMFRVIQYVERQVVLYDSVEDSAFSALQELRRNKSLKDYINIANLQSDQSLLKKLSEFSTRIVFTAHPTQFYPPSVLDIISNLRSHIIDNDINDVDLVLRQLGLTSFINSSKPTPLEEAKNIIYFLRNVYYEAASQIYTSIKNNLDDEDFDNASIIQFGFWPGGDRDGNPFVTAETTRNVADELRMTLMKCYYADIKALQKKLTFRKVEQIVSNLRQTLYDAMFNPNQYIQYESIISPLNKIKTILIRDYSSLYIEELDKVMDRVNMFKIHFANLDIRQNHGVHHTVIESIFIKQGIIKETLSELTQEELKSHLLRTDIRVNANDYTDPLTCDTIRNISQLKDIQKRNGEAGCNRYIISNSEDIYAVLYVQALLSWCCYGDEKIPFDIVPLFESMDGMVNSKEIMNELFNLPEYKKHLEQRENVQPVMLGFSDGTKDGGYLKANWSIIRTKENLSELCADRGVKVIFFDGRGGPPARGGGKTHRFYASQPDKIANHAIQLTIQGQTITSIYGTKEQFTYNAEQLLTAGISHQLSGDSNIISTESRTLIERLADLSFEKYTSLKNHEMFIPYLENKSTLKFYSKANIGSRPAKRGKKAQLTLDDLRAISFVGSWSQLKQNVPGYFGVGTALKQLVDEGQLSDLQKLFREVPFFKALISNSMMSLSKCYFKLTRYIAQDEAYADFWNILHDEYQLSLKMTLLISQYDILMQEEPISRKSIEIREQIVLPLLVIQQCALQNIESGSEYKESYEKMVERSLYGNINASRNSA